VNGTLEIPNLSEEQDMEDIEVHVTLTSDNTADRRKVKDLVRKAGGDLIRDQLVKWLSQLKNECVLMCLPFYWQPLPCNSTVLAHSCSRARNQLSTQAPYLACSCPWLAPRSTCLFLIVPYVLSNTR
jgi:hypothetical protein